MNSYQHGTLAKFVTINILTNKECIEIESRFDNTYKESSEKHHVDGRSLNLLINLSKAVY